MAQDDDKDTNFNPGDDGLYLDEEGAEGAYGDQDDDGQNYDDADYDDAYDDSYDDRADDEWDSYDEDFAGEQELQAGKKGKKGAKNTGVVTGSKKGNRTNQLIIGGGIALGLVVMILNFAGGGKKQQGAPVAQPIAVTTQTGAPAAAPVPNNAPVRQMDLVMGRGNAPVTTQDMPAGTGLFDDASSLDNIDNSEERVTQADVMRQTLPMPVPVAGTLPDNTELAPLPAPPEQTAALLPSGTQDDGASAPAAPPSLTASEENTGELRGELATLSGRLDTVLTRLDSVEGKISDLERTGALADAQALQESISAIQRKLDQLAAVPARQAAPKKAAPARRKPTQAAAPRKTPPKPARSPVDYSGGWVLRSAQPGQALVARPGEPGVQSIAVGNSLAGIGRVTGIYYQDRQWIVQGTSGRITQ